MSSIEISKGDTELRRRINPDRQVRLEVAADRFVLLHDELAAARRPATPANRLEQRARKLALEFLNEHRAKNRQAPLVSIARLWWVHNRGHFHSAAAAELLREEKGVA